MHFVFILFLIFSSSHGFAAKKKSKAKLSPCPSLIEGFLELYPEQDPSIMLTRIKNAKDKHKFLRSFIPLFYKKAFELKNELPIYHKLKKITGQISGDAHVENFGFMTDSKGNPSFVLNDFDDVAEGPLFLDVLRLSQSASYVSDANIAMRLDAYKAGLANADHKYSKYINKLNKKSINGGEASKVDYIISAEGLKFAVKTEPSSPVSDTIRKNIDLIIQTHFTKNAKTHDTYHTIKESGGSAFNDRYHTLVEDNGKVHMIEFKEIANGGVVKEWVSNNVTNEQRVLNGIQTFLGNDFKKRLDVVRIEDKPFQMRFKMDGNKSIDLLKVSEKELPSVIQDEFYLLGQIHRKSLGESEDKIRQYLLEFQNTTAQEWQESVTIMRKNLKELYELRKSN